MEPHSQQLEGIGTGLRSLLKAGLPVRPATAPAVLLALDSVTAHSIDPADALARVDALDRLLREELRRFGLIDLRRAASALFGVRRGGATLTERRLGASKLADYETNHFRKRIEPKIVQQLAWQLYRSELQYVQRQNSREPFAASGDTPTITEEHVAEPQTAEHEVLLSRVWSDVYGLRAELIAREAARDDPQQEAAFQEAAMHALWYLARLLTKLDTYLEHYGRSILHGAAEYDANALIRLAGWTGEVTKEQARELRFHLARHPELPAFRRAVEADAPRTPDA